MALSGILLPLTNPVFWMMVMLVMSLLFLLLLLQETGWLLLAKPDPHIGRTAAIRMLALVAATTLRRWIEEMSGFSNSIFGTWSGKSSSKPHWSLGDSAIAGSVPGVWILRRAMLWILPIMCIEPCARKNENPCRDDKLQLCVRYQLDD